MKTYDLILRDGDETISVSMRLTGSALRRLENDVRFGKKSANEIISIAMTRISCAMAIFDNALTYKGNENTVKDGETLFDLMAENDMAGEAGIAMTVVEIARVSGIFSEEAYKQVVKNIHSAYDETTEEQTEENPIN